MEKFNGRYFDLSEEIRNVAKKNNAIILSHYYQEPEIQDLADFTGDSLELSRKAASTNADIIVFCGVYFMAEVAKILNPSKQVLLPDLKAGCSLANSCSPELFKKFRERYQNHIAITYINCSAEVKALSDIICTSSNAEKIINQIPKDKDIIFAPDKFLGRFLEKRTGRKMVLWPGTCIVHESFSERDLVSLMFKYKEAHIIAHPECPDNLLRYANFIGSTSKLLQYVSNNIEKDFIVLTEEGIIHQMKKISPNSKFYIVGASGVGCSSCSKCPYMRLNTLEKIYDCLVNKSPEVNVKEDIRYMAMKSLNAMMAMS